MEYKDESKTDWTAIVERIPNQTPHVVLLSQLAGEIRICDLHCLQITLITFVFPEGTFALFVHFCGYNAKLLLIFYSNIFAGVSYAKTKQKYFLTIT